MFFSLEKKKKGMVANATFYIFLVLYGFFVEPFIELFMILFWFFGHITYIIHIIYGFEEEKKRKKKKKKNGTTTTTKGEGGNGGGGTSPLPH